MKKIDVRRTIRRFNIEGTSVCNYNCSFCPHNIMKRPKGHMDFSIFKKIIDEIKFWKIEDLSLTGFGEPLLDSLLSKKIKYAKENMPKNCNVEFNTNALLLTKKKFIEVAKAGVDEIMVSCYSTGSKSHEKLHGVKAFEKIKQNLSDIRKIKKETNMKKPIISMGLIQPKDFHVSRKEWLILWKDVFDKYYEETRETHNWAGTYKGKYKKRKRLSCDRIFSSMQILWDGEVSVCCMDYEGKVIFGSVKNYNLNQIINSNKFQAMLRIHKKRDFRKIPLCDGCDELVPATLKNKLARWKFKHIEKRFAGR